MPLSVPCPSCKRSYSLDEELYQSRIASHVVSFRGKECGATASLDGTKDGGPKVLGEDEEVAGALTADDLGQDPSEIDEIDDEEVASLPPESLQALASALADAAEDLTWVVNEEEGADDEELREGELIKRIGSGKLSGDVIVWREGMPDWLPVADIPVLAKHLPKSGPDKTGGFLGTGMAADFKSKDADEARGESKSVPPPLPPKKRSSDPRSGKPVALSRGLLFSVDEDETQPDPPPVEPVKPESRKLAPKPPLKSKPAVTRDLDFSDIGEEEAAPSSTGTPALQALTSKVPPVPNKAKDDFLVSLGGGDEEVLGPPSIDISDLAKSRGDEAPDSESPDSEAPESEVPESDLQSSSTPNSGARKKKKKKKKKKKRSGSRAPGATPSRRPRPSESVKARPEPSPERKSSEERSGAFWKVVLVEN
jgi:hypothetical protein